MLHESNSFLDMIEVPVDGTRPHRTSWGVGFSLGASNSMGSYAQFLNGSADWPADSGDGCGIYLEFSTVNQASDVGDALVTIGIDLAGGTSYTDWIQYLLISGAPILTLGQVSYYFQVRIPRGASLAVKGQSASAAPIATSYVSCKIPIKPTHPELLRLGTFVQTFGADAANSRGTAITVGTGSEGSPTQIGSALDKPIWAWEVGFGSSSAAITGNTQHIDVLIGDASNKRPLITTCPVHGGTAENLEKQTAFEFGDGAVGDLLYARGQASVAFSATSSIIVYGVGGDAGMIAESNSFLLTIMSPADGVQPGTGYGVNFTPGASNSMGSYVQLIDGATAWPAGCSDGMWLTINVFDLFVPTEAHSIVFTLGIDLAGGSSYTDWIVGLLAGCANSYFGNSNFGGSNYELPIRVPRGSSIAIKAQDSHATPPTGQAEIRIYCNPTHPELVRCGTFVQAFGLDIANSVGTTVTPGTTSDGTPVQLGSALDKPIWYWEFGIDIRGTAGTPAMASNVHVVDIKLGDASNKRRVIRNGRVITSTAEYLTKFRDLGEFGDGAIGDLVYGNAQTGESGVGSTVMTLVAYGVGG